MPCWISSRIELEFLGENFDLLEKAIQELGYRPARVGETVRFRTGNGEIVIRDGKINASEADKALAKELRRQYSREIIKEGTKYDWAVTQVNKNHWVTTSR